jgi:hypothetical protein
LIFGKNYLKNDKAMNKEEFIQKAKSKMENFELHKRLITFFLCDRENKNYANDLIEFAEKQVVDGNLLLSLMEYAEAYHEERNKTQLDAIKHCICQKHEFGDVTCEEVDNRCVPTCKKCEKPLKKR